MIEKIQKYQRLILIGLIVICMGIMALGTVVYLERIKDKLEDDAVQGVIENNKPMDEGPNVDVSELEGKVSMTVSADSVGDLDITITNNSDVDIDMGRDIFLQKMVSETWKDVPLSLNYRGDLIVISPDECHTFHYDIGSAVVWESNTTYQIVKVVSAGQTDYSVFASFEIQ